MIEPDLDELSLERVDCYTKVIIPQLPFISVEGEPDLPGLPLKIALPTGCVATNIQVQEVFYDTLPGFHTVFPTVLIPCDNYVFTEKLIDPLDEKLKIAAQRSQVPVLEG